MMTTVLLIATQRHWVGAARFPRSLQLAGLNVVLLSTPDTWLTKTRFVDHKSFVPETASHAHWIHAIEVMMNQHQPAFLLVADDPAFLLLTDIALLNELTPNLPQHQRVRAFIEQSLGDKNHYAASVDKLVFTPTVAAAGVSCAAWAIVKNQAEALAFSAKHAHQTVLKQRFSHAGSGVRLCQNQAELEATYPAFAQDKDLLIQAQFEGKRHYQATLCWHGEIITSWTVEALGIYPPPMGPSTRTRHYHNPVLHAATQQICRLFGLHGIFAIEFLYHKETAQYSPLEINRRISPNFHCGSDFDVDLAIGLRNKLLGEALQTRAHPDQDEYHDINGFPQVWYANPEDTRLRHEAIDAPWDDPTLMQAFVNSSFDVARA
jgi:biotin carboxylase